MEKNNRFCFSGEKGEDGGGFWRRGQVKEGVMFIGGVTGTKRATTVRVGSGCAGRRGAGSDGW